MPPVAPLPSAGGRARSRAPRTPTILLFVLGAALSAASDPFGAATKGAGKLDLRLDKSAPVASVEGGWDYVPLDGGEPIPVTITRTRNGFYEFAGSRVGEERPLIEFDRDGPSRYRGRIREGLDSCVESDAPVLLTVAGSDIALEITVAAGPRAAMMKPGPCRDAARFYLVSRAKSGTVRLRPPSDLSGVGVEGDGPSDRAEPKVGAESSLERTQGPRKGGESISIAAPEARDGEEVVLLGTVRDARERVWHLVRLISAQPEEIETGAAGELPADDRTARHGGKPKEPPSGYVPQESLTIRWEGRLEKAASRERPDGGVPEGP